MKCKELQISDWIADKNGFQWQIIGVGDDYATFEDNEGDCCEFNDKDDQPEGILLTKEMLDDNGFRYEKDYGPFYRSVLGSHHYTSPMCVCVEWMETTEGRKICYIECVNREHNEESYAVIRREFYVHTLQHALRLVGLKELADNFKV